ncbi:MAG: AraC family transcriptional regulator [Verrucomicrobiota bacterium]
MAFYKDINFLQGDFAAITTGIIDRKHRDYYCLQYNHAGPIQIQIGKSAPKTIAWPCTLFTFPGPRFRFGTKGTDTWHHSYLAFSGKRVQRYIDAGLLSRENPICRVHDSEHFLQSFTKCVKAMKRGPAGHSMAVHTLDGMLFQLLEEGENFSEEPQQNNYIKKLVDQIQDHPEEPWDFQEEANRAHVSYGHFRRCFKTATKEAPGQFLINVRLAKAADLLAHGEIEIKEIASLVAIPDIHYFTKLFRRRYQLPPARFRQELQGAP